MEREINAWGKKPTYPSQEEIELRHFNGVCDFGIF